MALRLCFVKKKLFSEEITRHSMWKKGREMMAQPSIELGGRNSVGENTYRACSGLGLGLHALYDEQYRKSLRVITDRKFQPQEE